MGEGLETVTSILSVVGTVVLGIWGWLLKQKVAVEKIKKAKEQLDVLHSEVFLKNTWIAEAVQFAEEKLWENGGQEKYNEVMLFVTRKAKEAGIEIDTRELEIMINAEVHRIRKGFKDEWVEVGSVDLNEGTIVLPETEQKPIV